MRLSSLLIFLLLLSTNVFSVDNIALPFPCNKSYTVTQGNSGSYSHKRGTEGQYAFDFGMSIGQIVTAVAPGRVERIRESAVGHCLESGCPANFVLIDHFDGTESLYLHLDTNGVNVEVGDMVVAGQPIAMSGHTGHSTGPHLHFQVQRDCGYSYWCQSIEVRFKDFGIPSQYDSVGNTCTCPSGYSNYATCSGNTLKQCVNGEGINRSCTNCVSQPSGTHDICQGEIISTGTVTFLEPLDGETVDNPVLLRAKGTGDVVTIKYFSDTYPLGESNDADDDYEVTYSYHNIGQREVVAKGYNANGQEIASARASININIVEAGSGTARFITPSNNGTTNNPVVVKASVTGDVSHVKYYADNRFLIGESSNASDSFRAEKLFYETGVRELNVRGYNSQGVRITGASQDITVTVLEPVTCDHECNTEGDKYCESSSRSVECLTDNSGCRYWGNLDICGSNELCQNGECETTANHECGPEGIKHCNGTKVEICSMRSGILKWNTYEYCDGGEVCDNGQCLSSCSDRCTNGQKRCSGNNIEICGRDFDADDCTEWGSHSSCHNNETCNNGVCVPVLNHECGPQGTKRCHLNGVEICKVNNSGVLVWETLEHCGAGEICDAGECSSSCSDRCTFGEKRCDGNIVELCGTNFDSDPCTEWGEHQQCSGNNICENGSCVQVIQHECGPEGSKQCHEDKIEVCKKDNYGTLKWEEDSTCLTGEVCDNGECLSTCADRCTVGEKKCWEDYAQICDVDFDADTCSEWGTLERCDGRGEKCIDGACIRTCMDECPRFGEMSCSADKTQVFKCVKNLFTGCYELKKEMRCMGSLACENGYCQLKDNGGNNQNPEPEEPTNTNEPVSQGCHYDANNHTSILFFFLILFLITLRIRKKA